MGAVAMMLAQGAGSGGGSFTVSSLLHFDGADGSATFTDVSGKVWTPVGDAQIDTAQSKFGGAAGLFDGAGDRISTPSHADFDFGSGDFTVEIQRRGNSLAGSAYQGLVCRDEIGGTRGWLLFTGDDTETTPDGLQFAAFVGATAYAAKDTVSAGTGAWQHVAAVRDGGTLRLYKDGMQVGSTAITGSINAPSQPCVIGALWGLSAPLAGTFFNGWIDEVRITKGLCRYPSGTTFTPPTAAFT
jgi:hypothetical protein